MVPSSIIVHAVNSRVLQIAGDYEEGLIYEKDDIIGLDCTAAKYSYKVKFIKGGILRIGKNRTPYLVNSIINYAEDKYLEVSTCPLTKGSQFLLPMLFESSSEISIWRNNFINVYVTYEGSKKGLGICLLYRFSSELAYSKFEDFLLKHKSFDSLHEPDKYHTLYEFKVPEEFISDFLEITEGRYSKTSERYKRRVMSFFGFKEGGTMHGILYKSEKLRQEREEEYDLPSGALSSEDELYDQFNLEEETYWNKYNLITDVTADSIG